MITAECVSDEYFSLWEAVDDVIVVHQLASVKRAPSPAIRVGRTRSCLQQVTLFREVSRQQRKQIALVGIRESNLKVMEFGATNRLIPIHDDLSVLVINENVSRRVR